MRSRLSAPDGPVLGIDGSLGAFSAALVSRSGEVLASRTLSASRALEGGLAAIAAVLEGRGIAALSGVAAGTGPGSFTGTRIALSYAKAIALAGGLPLYAVSSFDALRPPATAFPLVSLIPARSDLACVRYEDAGIEQTRCGSHDELAEWVLSFGRSSFDFAGVTQDDPLRLAERGCHVRIFSLNVPAAVRIAQLAPARAPALHAHAVSGEYGFPAAGAA